MTDTAGKISDGPVAQVVVVGPLRAELNRIDLITSNAAAVKFVAAASFHLHCDCSTGSTLLESGAAGKPVNRCLQGLAGRVTDPLRPGWGGPRAST